MNIKNITIEIVQADINELDTDVKVNECATHDQAAIRQAVADAISAAQSNKHKSISFSDLGCSHSDFPLAGVAKIIVQEVMNYARAYDDPSLEKVIFCLKEREVFEVFDKTIRGYIKHMLEDLGFGPYVTVDIIIEHNDGIILIERSNPPYGWALPGGFLDYGESLEEAAVREAKEETNLDLIDLSQFHTYSKPGRDPRFQTISTVFTAKGIGEPRSGDDAKDLKVIQKKDLLALQYAFDHKNIIKEYLEINNGK